MKAFCRAGWWPCRARWASDEIESFDKPINQWSVIVRAAGLHRIGDIRVADEPAPTSAAEQTLVRVTAVGIQAVAGAYIACQAAASSRSAAYCSRTRGCGSPS